MDHSLPIVKDSKNINNNKKKLILSTIASAGVILTFKLIIIIIRNIILNIGEDRALSSSHAKNYL